MSAVLFAQQELPLSSNLVSLSSVTSIRSSKLEVAGNPVRVAPANLKLYRPISGLVGHAFIRLCLWFDLLSSWKKRTNAPSTGSFISFADSELETEAVPHATAS